MKTEAEWLNLFGEQESSGLAEDIFCEQKEVSHWKFCQMRRDLIKRGLGVRGSMEQPTDLSLLINHVCYAQAAAIR